MPPNKLLFNDCGFVQCGRRMRNRLFASFLCAVLGVLGDWAYLFFQSIPCSSSYTTPASSQFPVLNPRVQRSQPSKFNVHDHQLLNPFPSPHPNMCISILKPHNHLPTRGFSFWHHLRTLRLPLLRCITLRGPRVDSRDLGFERCVYETVAREGGLFGEERGHDYCGVGLAAAALERSISLLVSCSYFHMRIGVTEEI